jgi:hypothetical protein
MSNRIDEKYRCKATSKSTGERCKRAASKGALVCVKHGAGAPQVKAAAQRRELERKAVEQAQRMVAKAGVDQGPIEHLLESLHHAAQLQQVWGTMVSELDDAAEEENKDSRTRGELGYEEETDEKSPYELIVVSKDRLLALDRHGQAGVHPFVAKYEEALERRAKLAKLCLDAGVAERQVQITETQVAVAHEAFEAGLASLKLTDAQKQEARRAYANRLRRV